MSKQAMVPNIARAFSFEAQRAERHGKALACLIRSLRCSGAVLLVLFMVFFFLWGSYKVLQPEKYVEIRTETFPWEGEAMELPQIGFDSPDDQTIEVRRCTIENGDLSTKQCEKVETYGCQLEAQADIECLPTLMVEGTFGDSQYTYVAIRSFLRNETTHGFLSLKWKQRESLTWIRDNTQLYSSVKHVPMSNELYFQKVTALQGETFGILGRTGNDESEDLLHKESYMAKTFEYTYVEHRNRTNDHGEILGRSLYLRATKTQREDFYEVYSIMKLLESLGGLYTSFSFILFVPLLIASKVLRCSGLLMDRTHSDVFDPAAAVVETSTEAPLEGGVSQMTEQRCQDSSEPEVGSTPRYTANFMKL